MKKNLFIGLLLICSIATIAQVKSTDNKDVTKKWRARLRIIDAVPPASSYSLTGADVKISSSVVPELDFSYFFNNNLALELILGTTHHKVTAEGSGATTNLGEVWLLPPTLNLQYHFPMGSFKPYVGAGLNYSLFYSVKDDAASLSYTNNVGISTQFGFDYNLNDKWFLNFDVKKIFVQTDVTVKGTPNTVLSGVKVDPWVIGLGVGIKF